MCYRQCSLSSHPFLQGFCSNIFSATPAASDRFYLFFPATLQEGLNKQILFETNPSFLLLCPPGCSSRKPIRERACLIKFIPGFLLKVVMVFPPISIQGDNYQASQGVNKSRESKPYLTVGPCRIQQIRVLKPLVSRPCFRSFQAQLQFQYPLPQIVLLLAAPSR